MQCSLRPIYEECKALFTGCVTRTEKAVRLCSTTKKPRDSASRSLTKVLRGAYWEQNVSLSCHDDDPARRPHVRPLPCPDYMYLIKWKSNETIVAPMMKGREVLTPTLDPLSPVTSLCGRALTRFWKEVVAVLAPKHSISMSSVLHCVRNWTQQHNASAEWVWVEYDIRDMFPEIPRHELFSALQQLKTHVQKHGTTRSRLNFFLGKDANRKLDNLSWGRRSQFTRLTFTDVLHVVLFDLQLNDFLVPDMSPILEY